ncbi:MAG: helix-turn-helix domain-containing protein [Pseudonocardiales bacterium]
MKDLEPTIRTRELGKGIRRAIAKVGLTGQQVARQLGWHPSQVSRLLSGRRHAT